MNPSKIYFFLADLGAGRDEVLKSVPDFDGIMRRSKATKKKLEASAADAEGPKAKKVKLVP